MPLDGTLEKSNVLKPALEVDSALTGAANEDTLETLEASLRTDLRTAELMSAFARLVKRDGFCLVLRIEAFTPSRLGAEEENWKRTSITTF